MTKIYKRRPMVNLHSPGAPLWAQLGDPDGFQLSHLLGLADREPLQERIFLCGELKDMSREYMTEPLDEGWEFSGEFVFKHRVAVYHRPETPDRKIGVRLISHRESWLPNCESILTAIPAWRALESEWASTGLPLLSSPAATGKALLWETLPCDRDGNPIEFPALPDDLARLIRANSPQHRIQVLRRYRIDMNAKDEDFLEPVDCIQYDGRWMYASLCGLDRFPVGLPRRAGGFREYVPGVYNVLIEIPETWDHIGLLPRKKSDGGWGYPFEPGLIFDTWAFEPELTMAIKHGWKIIEVHDGYAFEKGRPLLSWSNKLIEMRKRLQIPVWSEGEKVNVESRKFAAAAIRQILNHTIGSIHKNEYQRETFVSDDNYRQWRRDNPFQAEGDDVLKVEGGYVVPCFVPDTSRLSIFMPHWSATLYSLARARVAEWALRCDPSTLVKVHGDAIYSTIEQPELDKLDTQKLGQPRRKS